MDREQRLSDTFVELADTLVTGFDIVDLIHTLTQRCVELTDVDAAGIMLADGSGTLHVIGSSSERSRLLELLEVQSAEGPCLDAFRDGETVVADFSDAERWPTVAPEAVRSGFGSVVALPMRLRHEAIGALNLFRNDPAPLPAADVAICRALADVATIGLLQERAVREARLLADQLQSALNTRVVLEQAKGVLAERSGIDVDVAFDVMRVYARRVNRPLGEVARDVVEGRLSPGQLA